MADVIRTQNLGNFGYSCGAYFSALGWYFSGTAIGSFVGYTTASANKLPLGGKVAFLIAGAVGGGMMGSHQSLTVPNSFSDGQIRTGRAAEEAQAELLRQLAPTVQPIDKPETIKTPSVEVPKVETGAFYDVLNPWKSPPKGGSGGVTR